MLKLVSLFLTVMLAASAQSSPSESKVIFFRFPSMLAQPNFRRTFRGTIL
jgi:hypothetical protein